MVIPKELRDRASPFTATQHRAVVGVCHSRRTILTVYEKPTCTTCRKLRALLAERALLSRPVERVLELL